MSCANTRAPNGRWCRKNEKKVCDRHGHEVGLDGELNGGEELVIKARAPAEPRS